MLEVSLRDLYDFKSHPFHVNDDEEMLELIQSVKEKGILTPPIVRPHSEGGYEIITGHRRRHAAMFAGLSTIPVLIRDLSDEDTVDVMVYSNFQRTNVLPSEKAFAYRMQCEVTRHPGKKGVSAPEEIGKKYGDNAREVQRYIRLNELLPSDCCQADGGIGSGEGHRSYSQ